MTNWVPRYGPALRSIVLAVLLVVAAVAATWAVLRTGPDEGLSQPGASSGDPLRVAVIGDSFSAGVNNSVVWTDILSDNPALSIANVARAGSGYVGGAGTNGTFAQQVNLALAAKPQVIVVFGGIYDLGKSSDLISQSATDLLNDLHLRAPNARIVTIGPIWHQHPPADAVVDVNRAIARAAEQTHTEYIDLLNANWLDDPVLLAPDQNSPNDAGQRILAAQLGDLLQPHLTARGPE